MIDAKTKLIAVIGNPIEHSYGPAIHNAAFANLGLNYVYFAFNVTNLKTAIEAMKELSIAGYSVTLPHKETIIKYLDRLDPIAAKIQAVNTVVNKNGLLTGYNTDAAGAINALKQKTQLHNKKVALLGAGGAARAIAFALQQEGAQTTIFNRTFEKAKKLARAANCEYMQLPELEKFKADILVNATSVGMYPHTVQSPIGQKILGNFSIVFDAIYNPIETQLLKQARQLGKETVSGVEMFLGQAAGQFTLWTGKEAPRELMREIVLKEMQK